MPNIDTSIDNVTTATFLTLTARTLVGLLRKTDFSSNLSSKTMFFDRFFPKLPSVKAQDDEEAELVDPQQVLRDKCMDTEHCKHLSEKYQTCNDRVNSRSQTTETCIEELFDLLHAVNHCVTKDLFSKLK